MKKILLTGGAGFIGSNLTRRLLEEGKYHVTCIDNFDAFYPRELKEENIRDFADHQNYRFIEGDIRRQVDLAKVDEADMIIHLAAKAGVRQSICDPLIYQDVNIAGTQNVLEFARHKKISQFIFASSSSVYGVSPHLPWNEEERLLPISPYACSKLSDEMLGYVYSHLYGIRFIALRFFTVYGPGQRPDLAIHQFFVSISDQKPIRVFGDGNTFRDYTYIDDIVLGVEAAMEYESSPYEIINLGSNNPITLNKLIQEIENTIGIKAIIDRRPDQPGDVPATFADIGKARRLLNYSPSTSLQQGLNHFYKWLNSRQS